MRTGHAALLAQLEALADCPLAGACLHIKAQRPHAIKLQRATT